MYPLINIHQRTKTTGCPSALCAGISLSISIREPKLYYILSDNTVSISLSISIREPKLCHGVPSNRPGISLSISIREPKPIRISIGGFFVSAYQYPSENQNYGKRSVYELCVSAYQYPSENQNCFFALEFNAIRISLSISIREPKRGVRYVQSDRCISLSISIREPKPKRRAFCRYFRISLSISIREPKPGTIASLMSAVSAYQYPSENQNWVVVPSAAVTVSAYQYPSENQNRVVR